MAVTYSTPNGVKPRYDGGGTEFGKMHRDLGPGYLLFDIDRLSVKLEEQLELRKENEGFIEYRLYSNHITFIAMFELKAQWTPNSKMAIDTNQASSIARAEIAKRLSYDQDQPCRLFVVFGTNGRQPFEFYEFMNNEFVFVGTLDYLQDNRQEKVKLFWNDTLGISK